MRTLIVGGSSALAKTLRSILPRFAEVLTAGRSGCDMHLDLSAPDGEILIPKGIDVVVNAAAHFGGNDADSIVEAVDVNVLGALKLCKACISARVQFLVSISSVNACLDESSDYFEVYALSKRQSDEAVQLFCSSQSLPCAILRPSQLYGNEEGFRKHQLFLYTVLDRAQKNEDILIYGSRDAMRNYLHADDLCQVILRVIENRIEGQFVCTHPVDVSLSDVAYAAIKAFRSSSSVHFSKEMKSMSDNVFPYDDSLYAKTRCFPSISLNEGLQRIAAHRFSQL